jgi:hypothetical protein
MTSSKSVSKQHAFMFVFLELREVIETAAALASNLIAPHGMLELVRRNREQLHANREHRGGEKNASVCGPRRTESESTSQNIETFLCSINAALDGLGDMLNSEILTRLEHSSLLDLKQAILHLQAEIRERGLFEIDRCTLNESAECIQLATDASMDYCEQLATGAFGCWGAYWVRMTIEVDGEQLPYIQSSMGVTSEEIVRELLAPSNSDAECDRQRSLEERNQWIYNQVMAGFRFPAISKELKKNRCKWGRVSSDAGIKKIARKYAIDNGLPAPEPRRPGRPPRV